MLAAIDNLLFLLLVAIAALFRLLTKAAGSKREQTTEDESTFPKPDLPRQQPPPRARPRSDDEQIRKFLEALGQPRTSNVPPPVTPRTDVPPRPVAPVQPPRTFGPKTPAATPARAYRVEPTETSKPPPSPPRMAPVRRESKPEAPTFEVRETTVAPFPETELSAQPKPAPDTGTLNLVQLLRSPGGLRQAVILREILGTPRSLQSIEELPGTA